MVEHITHNDEVVGSFPTPGKGMIKKIKGKYVVMSETTGRSFGAYPTLQEAKRRLGQVEFFKRRAMSAKKYR